MNLKKLILDAAFLDEVQQPIFVKNKYGVYVYCNKAFTEFLGIHPNRILNHTAYDIAPQSLAKIYTKADKLLFESAKQQQYLSNIQTQTRSEVKVIFNKSVLYTPNHEIAGFIGAVETHNNLIKEPVTKTYKLTTRESEVLGLLAQGKPAKVIASMLMISSHTVADHLKSIYLKLNAHSKSEAIYKAIVLLSTKPE